MLSQILATIKEKQLVAPGDRVLVAVSGGPDSTALLHALLRLSGRLKISIAAATVDHGLRSESAAEAARVAQSCGELGVPCDVLAPDVVGARRPHVSIQEAARNARLAALSESAARLGCGSIALAHHADDQVETILFRIVRGTGVTGLAGIPYRRQLFIRPLLDVRRAQILQFLAKRRIAFIQDPSNLNRRFARVRVRLDWLPMLAQENPKIVDALLALSRDAIRASEGRESGVVALPGGVSLSRRTAAVVDRLVRDGAGTRRVAVHEGDLVVSYGEVTYQPRESSAHPMGPPPAAVEIQGPGIHRLSRDQDVCALAIDEGHGHQAPPDGAVVFDAARVALPLRLRFLAPGDRMRPRGGLGGRKVSHLLIDAKVPRPIRARLPVLTAADGTILFVPGLRPSDVGRPTPLTERWIAVRALWACASTGTPVDGATFGVNTS